MSIAKSDITGLDRDKIFADTFWLYYCCCAGVGLGGVGDPLIGSEVKELCLKSSCVTADLMASDGLCGGTTVMCCITQHSQIPPAAWQPKCMCCTKTKELPGSPADEFAGDLYDIGKIFGPDTFWLYYLLCFGCGVSGVGKDRPLYVAKQKMLIARQAVKLVPPIEDGVLCSGLATTCCFYEQLEIPPLKEDKGGPCIACCGWRQKNKK